MKQAIRVKNADRARELLDARVVGLDTVYRSKLEALTREFIPTSNGRSGVPVDRFMISHKRRVAAALPMLDVIEQERAPRTPWSMQNPLWEGGHSSAIHGLAEKGMTRTRPSSEELPRRGSRGSRE